MHIHIHLLFQQRMICFTGSIGQVGPSGFWSHACFLKQMLETRGGGQGEGDNGGENLWLPAWYVPKPELGAEHLT